MKAPRPCSQPVVMTLLVAGDGTLTNPTHQKLATTTDLLALTIDSYATCHVAIQTLGLGSKPGGCSTPHTHNAVYSPGSYMFRSDGIFLWVSNSFESAYSSFSPICFTNIVQRTPVNTKEATTPAGSGSTVLNSLAETIYFGTCIRVLNNSCVCGSEHKPKPNAAIFLLTS